MDSMKINNLTHVFQDGYSTRHENTLEKTILFTAGDSYAYTWNWRLHGRLHGCRLRFASASSLLRAGAACAGSQFESRCKRQDRRIWKRSVGLPRMEKAEPHVCEHGGDATHGSGHHRLRFTGTAASRTDHSESV